MTGHRRVAAPGLRETAEIWWDVEADPVVEWSEDGRRFALVSGVDPTDRLELWRAPKPCADPERIARVLAEGLAACDFPPTASGPGAARIEATLRAHGIRAE